MPERPSDRELVRRGREAERLLENQLLKDCFEELKGEFVDAWRNSKLGQSEEREVAYQMHTALVEVESRLTKYVGQGKVAAKLLEEQEKAAKNGGAARTE